MTQDCGFKNLVCKIYLGLVNPIHHSEQLWASYWDIRDLIKTNFYTVTHILTSEYIPNSNLCFTNHVLWLYMLLVFVFKWKYFLSSKNYDYIHFDCLEYVRIYDKPFEVFWSLDHVTVSVDSASSAKFPVLISLQRFPRLSLSQSLMSRQASSCSVHIVFFSFYISFLP